MNPLHRQIGPAPCPRQASGRPAGQQVGRLAGLLACWSAGLLVWCLAGGAFAQTVTPLVSLTNTVWRYNDLGTDLGSAWHASNYLAESSWRTGRGLFGVESTIPYPYPEPVRTPLVLNAGRTTYYFRTHFNFAFNPAGLMLRGTAYVDDGAVFYLNGVELYRRVRLPDGPITFTNKAQLASPEGEAVLLDFPATNVFRGDNVLAVEVHQHSDTSSDVVFGFALEIVTAEAPVITDLSEPADRAVAQGESTTLSVAATGFPPPDYQWFKDGAAIPGEIGPTLALANMSLGQAGNYFCRVSNSAGSVTSRTAAVAHLPDTNGPAILHALGRPSPYEVLVVFSEPPNVQEATDNFNWEIQEAGGGASLLVASGFLENATTLTLVTSEPREPNQSYVLRLVGVDLHELVDHGNVLRAGTEVPIALFETTLIQNDETHPWRYDESGADLSATWASPGYDDSGWLTGAGPFDAFRLGEALSPCRATIPGISPPDDVVHTCLTLSNAANTALIPTAYFRTHFTFAGDAAHSVLSLQTIVNDGAVFYLNGVELARLGMPDGTITYNTPARAWAGPPVFTQLDVDAPSLIAGENVLAVELHQADLGDPLSNRDFTFALRLLGVLPSPPPPPPPPRLTVRLAGGNLIVNWVPGNGILESTDDPSGPWTTVAEAYAPGEFTAPANEAKKFYRVSVP